MSECDPGLCAGLAIAKDGEQLQKLSPVPLRTDDPGPLIRMQWSLVDTDDIDSITKSREMWAHMWETLSYLVQDINGLL